MSARKSGRKMGALPLIGLVVTIGVHAIYLENVVVTLEGGYLFPFDQVDDLAGFRATLAANFTLW